jgi:methylase of polypeptide subunit release factors
VYERRLPPGEPFSVAVRLFLLGMSQSAEAVEGAFDLAALLRSGWLERDGGRVRATLKLVPHGDLLVASDRDADGPTDADWVAGIHPPSVTLAKLTVRRQVERALDVATGNGIQALLASRHADAVVASDVNARALRFAELNAALNGAANVELRGGSYFEPVEDERFDLVTCNPPYVISPETRYVYRDSDLPGDTVSRDVVRHASEHLRDGGFASILVSWAHPADDWWSTPSAWVAGLGCDAWLLYFGSDDPLTHAASWLKPAARHEPGAFAERLDRWLDYLASLGIEAIAHGAVVLRRRAAARNWTLVDRVDLGRAEQASDHILRVFATQDWLESLDDEHVLLAARLALAERHRLDRTFVGGELRSTILSLEEGLAFQTGLDEHAGAFVPLLDGSTTVRDAVALRGAELGLGDAEQERFAAAALPVVRRLLQLGVLARGAGDAADVRHER